MMEPSINHYLQTVAGIYRSAVERSEIAPANVPERVERFGRTTSIDEGAERVTQIGRGKVSLGRKNLGGRRLRRT